MVDPSPTHTVKPHTPRQTLVRWLRGAWTAIHVCTYVVALLMLFSCAGGFIAALISGTGRSIAIGSGIGLATLIAFVLVLYRWHERGAREDRADSEAPVADLEP